MASPSAWPLRLAPPESTSESSVPDQSTVYTQSGVFRPNRPGSGRSSVHPRWHTSPQFSAVAEMVLEHLQSKTNICRRRNFLMFAVLNHDARDPVAAILRSMQLPQWRTADTHRFRKVHSPTIWLEDLFLYRRASAPRTRSRVRCRIWGLVLVKQRIA